MFGMLKNAGVGVAIGDLDRCIFYLTNSGEVPNSQEAVSQIANTIRHWCAEVGSGNADVKSVHNHFQTLKNQVLQNEGLRDHKHPDFCSYYILMSFFFCLMVADNESAKIAAIKIIDMCETKCEKSLQSTIKEVLKPLRQMFARG